MAEPIMRYFLIEGAQNGCYEEFERLDQQKTLRALRDSKDRSLTIELYLSRSLIAENREGNPEIGLVFVAGKYSHHGLGPAAGDTGSWMHQLLRFVNRFKEMDVSDDSGFVRMLFLIASVGYMGR